MSGLTKLDRWLLKRILTKILITGDERKLFGLLYDLDYRVHSEDNDATRKNWFRKWFREGFVPNYKRDFTPL